MVSCRPLWINKVLRNKKPGGKKTNNTILGHELDNEQDGWHRTTSFKLLALLKTCFFTI